MEGLETAARLYILSFSVSFCDEHNSDYRVCELLQEEQRGSEEEKSQFSSSTSALMWFNSTEELRHLRCLISGENSWWLRQKSKNATTPNKTITAAFSRCCKFIWIWKIFYVSGWNSSLNGLKKHLTEYNKSSDFLSWKNIFRMPLLFWLYLCFLCF